MNRRALVFSALWCAVSAVGLSAPGCYGRNCEGGTETYGDAVTVPEGRMLDPNTWESNAFNEEWLWYPRQRIYFFEVPQLGGRTPYLITPYVSARPNPMQTGDNMTVGSGNLAVMSGVRANHVDVRNDTCSDYYLRVVIQVPPVGSSTPADAGTNPATPDPDPDPDAGEAGVLP